MRNLFKKLLAVGLVAAMLLCSLPFSASAATYSGTCGDNLTWTLDTSTGELNISGTGKMTEAAWRSYSNQINTVTIGNGITGICESAFSSCENITAISIPNSVITIGSSAFRFCESLTSITIPDSVIAIGEEAFYSCDSLANVKLSTGLSAISDGLFHSCDKLDSIIIPNSVTTIGSSAFGYCESLVSITIPDSVTVIDDGAFYSCKNLKSVTIPSSVTKIGEKAFGYCGNIVNYTVDDENTCYSTDSYGALFNKGKTVLLQYPVANTNESYTIPDSVTTISDYAFYNGKNLKSITLPEGVTEIGEYAFYYCKKLENITIPEDVTEIGPYTFYYCEKLTSIVIPDNVKTIKAHAFTGCSGLTSVKIGSNVTSIGTWAFKYCRKLTDMTLPDSLTTIGMSAFGSCYALNTVTIGSGLAYMEPFVFESCSNLSHINVDANNNYFSNDSYGVLFNKDKTVLVQYPLGNTRTSYTVPSTVTTIDSWSFEDVRYLAEVIIPESVNKIGYEAFSNCEALENISIGNNVTSFGKNAFYNSAYYNNLSNWENGVLYIENYLLYVKPEVLTGSYKIRKGTKAIFNNTFKDCDNLTSIIIPGSVALIDEYAFSGCDGLTNVTMENGIRTIGAYAFYNCKKLTSIMISDSVTSINSSAFSGCSGLTDVTMGNGIRTIGASAFENCGNLTSIIIPNGVESIGSYAFYNCGKLADITISDSVLKIGELAFARTAYYNDSSNWEDGVLYIGNKLIVAENSGVSGTYSVKNGTLIIADWAFSSCSALTELKIPASVKSVGACLFGDSFVATTNLVPLERITVDSNNRYYSSDSSGVLFDKNKTTLFYFPMGSELKNYTVPYETNVIEEYAFCNCDNLERLYLSENIRRIGYGAIYKCDSLITVSTWHKNDVTDKDFSLGLKGGVDYDYDTDLASHSISSCANLKNIVLPDGIKTIGVYAVSGNGSLQNIVLPKTTTTLGEHAFASCVSLQYIVIPDGATEIDWLAFENCKSLSYVHIPASVTIIEDPIFYSTPAYICSDTNDCYAKTYADEKGIEFKICTGHDTTEHNHKPQIVTIPATCTTDGVEYTVCTECGERIGESKPIPAAHKPGEWYTVKSASCKEVGLKRKTCTVCGETVESAEIPKLSHTLGGWQIIKPSNYSETGIKKRACTVCGEDIETQIIPKLSYPAGENICNIGEETYSFDNFGDNDSAGGHCFGMSITSSAYHIRELDISSIGGSYNEGLYSLEESSRVKEPICYYQGIQGSFSRKSTVAGGTYYKYNYYDIETDWKEVVNYVKNHEYDGKGTLQIGFRKKNDGGHAINFLRYEIVNGQERIYAYDNNFPDTEVYFYKDSNGNIQQAPYSTFRGAIDCIALRSVKTYFSIIDDFDMTRCIYADKGTVSIPGATEYCLDGEVELGERVVFEIPAETQQVIIIPLTDDASFEYLDEKYSFAQADDETVGLLTLATNRNPQDQNVNLSFIKMPESISIKSPSTTFIAYGETLVLSIEDIELPEGYTVEWVVDGSGFSKAVSEDGTECRLTSTANGTATVTAKIVDENGEAVIDADVNEISDSITLTSKAGFFQKLISFFKNLFGVNRIIY